MAESWCPAAGCQKLTKVRGITTRARRKQKIKDDTGLFVHDSLCHVIQAWARGVVTGRVADGQSCARLRVIARPSHRELGASSLSLGSLDQEQELVTGSGRKVTRDRGTVYARARRQDSGCLTPSQGAGLVYGAVARRAVF